MPVVHNANRTPIRNPFEIAASSPLQNVGFGLLLLFLFLAFSRVLDHLLPNVRLALVLSLVVFLITMATGGYRRVIKSPIGLLLLAFTVWMVICVPFSSWRGGSFKLLKDAWLRSLLCFVMVMGLTVTLKQVRAALVTLGIATTVLALIALVAQVRVAGRLSQQVGQFANPNDLAQALLLGSPLLFLLGDAGGNPFRRIVITATLMPVLLALAQTGSRAAMLALACMMVYVFLRISPVKRLILVLVMAAASVTIVGLLPDTVRSRLTKLTTEEEIMSNEDEMAVASGAARIEIFKQAVKLTLRHPIFGVGPGVFQHAAVIDSNSQGKRAMWRETHNTYLQVSSESGFPGMFLYFGTLWVCYRELKSIRIRCQDNPKLAELYAMVVCFSTSLIGFLVTSAFSSIAYAFLLPTLLGIAGSLIMAAKQELVLAGAEDPQPVEEASRKGDVPGVPPKRARTTAIGSPRPATALERHLQAMKQRRAE